MSFELKSSILAVLTAVVLQTIVVCAQGSCGKTFNQSSGEITTPGYPTQLQQFINNSCTFKISVGNGRIKLTFVNVSLPNETIVHTETILFVIGSHELQSRVLYSRMSNAIILLALRPNVTTTVGYKGLRILYERIPPDLCRYSYQASSIEKYLFSPGFPGRYKPNASCEYSIETLRRNSAVQISFAALSLGPGDNLIFYEGTSDVILAQYTGTPTYIKTMASNVSFIRVVLHSSQSDDTSSRRYLLVYREIPKGSSIEEYYGEVGTVSSSNKSCVYTIRATYDGFFSGKVMLRFQNLLIPPGERIILTENPYGPTSVVSYLGPAHSRPIKYVVGSIAGASVEIKFNSSTMFDLTFKDANKSKPRKIIKNFVRYVSKLAYSGLSLVDIDVTSE